MKRWLQRVLRRPDFGEIQGRIDGAIEVGDYAAASRLLNTARERWPERAEVWRLAGEVALGMEDAPEACIWMRRAVSLAPHWVEAWAGLGQACIEAGRFAEARDALEKARALNPDSPEALYATATLLELTGQGVAASRLFRRAAELDPERYFVPVRVSRAQFDRYVQHALKCLPAHVRDALHNVEIGVMDAPRADLVPSDEPPLNPTLLGVFLGAARHDQGKDELFAAVIPARILLFQRNLERSCATTAELADQVVVTMFHEVGHYLGLDEDEVDARGLG